MNEIQDVGLVESKGAGRILLMEDEPSVARGLQMVLTEDGYGVDLASTGRDALEIFGKKGFDLLVADLRLPDMDGLEVIREVREKNPETEVVVITGYPNVSSAVTAMKMGASDYLPKPFWEDQLRSAVADALKGKGERDESPETERGGEDMSATMGTMGVESLGRPRVLLMEDEPSIAQGLKMVLMDEGYGVNLAMTGRSALETMNQESFDLLVADLRLPDMDGLEVIREVKEKAPETEVVVITGYATVESAVSAMKIGAYDYLPKPFTEEEFKTVVEGALKEKIEASAAETFMPAVTEEEKLIQKREVIRILNRTAEDNLFWRDLMETGSKALDGYRLSLEAKGAIVSGDLKWINEHVGELTQKQLMFIYKRLEREAW